MKRTQARARARVCPRENNREREQAREQEREQARAHARERHRKKMKDSTRRSLEGVLGFYNGPPPRLSPPMKCVHMHVALHMCKHFMCAYTSYGERKKERERRGRGGGLLCVCVTPQKREGVKESTRKDIDETCT